MGVTKQMEVEVLPDMNDFFKIKPPDPWHSS